MKVFLFYQENLSNLIAFVVKKLAIIIVLLVFVGVFYLVKTNNATESSKILVTEVLGDADIQINGTRPWDITVRNEEFYSQVVAKGSLGLGETYMEGMWDCPSIDQFIYHILNAKVDENENRYTLKNLWYVIQAKLFNLQNKSKSMDVIDLHYNLGNDLYIKMLGPTMAYSCGYWRRATNLNDAQNAKYDLICRKLKLRPGMQVLDIGCGFGGLAKFMAENYKVSVVGITLSMNQAEFAKQLCRGLPVEIRIQDYRDLTESFDRIVSVGMFEHVGPKNYERFMEVVNQSLKDGGLFLLHTIGGNASTTTGDPWINTYIFPGGVLPSIAEIGEASEGLFVMEDWHNFGPDYDKTLMAWDANFNKNWKSISKDYDQTFYRMWNYYLLSCAGTFRAKVCQLWQVVFSKNGPPGEYTPER